MSSFPFLTRRSLLRKSALWAGWTVVFVVLSEIGLRQVLPPPVQIPSTVDSEAAKRYGWAFYPHMPMRILNPDTGKVETIDRANSHGWKDVEHDYRKPPNTFRILVIGDSVTQGIPPTRQVYHRVLEDLLKSEGYPVEVIAIGVGGWSTDQEYLAYVEEGRKYRVDLVLSQFTHNDLDGLSGEHGLFDDALKPFHFLLDNGNLKIERRDRRLPEPSAWERLDRWLVLRSRFYLLARDTYFKRVAPTVRARAARNRFLANLLPEDAGLFAEGEESVSQKELWELYAAILRRWKTICEGERARLVVFTECCEPGELEFGFKWGLERRDGRIVKKTSKGDWIGYDPNKPRIRLEEVCAEIGIEVVPNRRSYQRYDYDPHPNPQGNRAMAEDIRDFLLEHPQFGKRLENLLARTQN